MAIGIEDLVNVSPASWPAYATVAPGDLTKYAPIGLGLRAPAVMQPWDDLNAVVARGSFYGSAERTGDPFEDAPVNDAAGGCVYFDSGTDPAGLAALLTILDVQSGSTAYAVYAAESANPPRDRYLAQIRIINFDAMDLFGARPDPGDVFTPQPLDVGQLINAFIDAQQNRWGRGMSSELRGTLDGDGDWAKEKLAFGFLIENGSNGVYRLWSRPWLVTK
jgi:hypothetical protein